jgi:hypothetical protein
MIKTLLLTLTLALAINAQTDTKHAVRIHLANGAVIEVDEAWETADGFWYKRGDATQLIDRSRVARVERGAKTIFGAAPPIRTASLPSLPPRYAGESGQAVHASLVSHTKALAKSKFETTPEYAARVRGIIGGLALPGGKKADAEITFVIPEVEFSYDADAGLVTFKRDVSFCRLWTSSSIGIAHYAPGVAAEWEVSPGDLGLECDGLGLSTKWGRRGYEVGRTGFGVRFRYSTSHFTSYTLAVPRGALRLLDDGIRFEADRARARRMDGPLSVAVTGRLLYPFAAYRSHYKRPSLDRPSETIGDEFYILFNPSTVRVFSPATGEVFASFGRP